MKLLVESSKCSGHGMCHALAGEVFELDNEGFNTVRDAEIEISPELAEQAKYGALGCPEQAIRIISE